VREYREIHFKPYRIIYQIVGRKVFIHCVLDGRRALQEVLEHRLLR
jgi:toxin ParE1/3/4